MERIESSLTSLPLLEAITPERLASLLDQSKTEREQLFSEQYKKYEQVVINQKITALDKKREQIQRMLDRVLQAKGANATAIQGATERHEISKEGLQEEEEELLIQIAIIDNTLKEIKNPSNLVETAQELQNVVDTINNFNRLHYLLIQQLNSGLVGQASSYRAILDFLNRNKVSEKLQELEKSYLKIGQAMEEFNQKFKPKSGQANLFHGFELGKHDDRTQGNFPVTVFSCLGGSLELSVWRNFLMIKRVTNFDDVINTLAGFVSSKMLEVITLKAISGSQIDEIINKLQKNAFRR